MSTSVQLMYWSGTISPTCTEWDPLESVKNVILSPTNKECLIAVISETTTILLFKI